MRKKKAKKNLRATSTDDYDFYNGVALNGEAGDSVYCDHEHLYNFMFTNCEAYSSDESSDELTVVGWPMKGSSGVGTCMEDENANPSEITENTAQKTTFEDGTTACGYYVQYQWYGDSWIYFEI